MVMNKRVHGNLTTVSIGRGLHLLRGLLVVPNTSAVGFCVGGRWEGSEGWVYGVGWVMVAHLQTDLA